MSKKTIIMIMVTVMAAVSVADIFNVVDDQRAYLAYGWWQNAQGLSCKVPSLTNGVFSFAEFDLGSDAAASATMNLYNSTGGLTDTANWDIELYGAQYDMTEGSAVVGYDTWDYIGHFVIPETGAASEGWYQADITSFYNANLGTKVTIWIVPVEQLSGNGPKFEDDEGTMGTSNSAYIETIPEPATLLLLSGGLLAIRRRHS